MIKNCLNGPKFNNNLIEVLIEFKVHDLLNFVMNDSVLFHFCDKSHSKLKAGVATKTNWRETFFVIPMVPFTYYYLFIYLDTID